MLPVPVRVGQAVDTVAQAGRPKTITGFQTHTTPVLLSVGERAELGTEKYIPGAWVQGCRGGGKAQRLFRAGRQGQGQRRPPPPPLRLTAAPPCPPLPRAAASGTLEGVVILRENPEYVETHE